MLTNGRAHALGALFVAALAMWPLTAQAERNVVVARVTAPAAAASDARTIEKDLTTLVGRRYWLVDASLFDAAVGTRPLAKLGTGGWKEVANRIGADAIVVAELELRRGGKRWILVGEVIEGQSGRSLGTFRVELRERRLDSTSLTVLEEKLGVIGESAIVGTEGGERLTPRGRNGLLEPSFATTSAPVAGRSRLGMAVMLDATRPLDAAGASALIAAHTAAQPAPDTAAEAARSLANQPAVPKSPTAPVAAPLAVDEHEAGPVRAARLQKDDANLDRAFVATLPERQLASAGAGGTDAGPTPGSAVAAEEEPRLLYRAVPAGRLTPNPAIELDLGLSVVKRDLAFSAPSGTPADMRPASYEGAAAASGVLEVAAFPFVIFTPDQQTLHGFGVGFAYERALGLDTEARVGADTEEFATTQRRLDVDLRWRTDLPFHLRPSIEAAVGFGRLGVVIDSAGMDIDLPDVDYTLLTAGLKGRIPLSGRVSLTVGGRYLHALDTGEIDDSAAFGDTSAWGLELDTGFLVEPIARLVFRAGARYTRMSLDVSAANATSGLDEYLGGYVTAGYLF